MTHEDDDLFGPYPEWELVAGSPSQRNWRGIGIALLVILVICALITTAVILLTPSSQGPKYTGTVFSLEDILSPNVSLVDNSAVWISASTLVYKDVNNTIWALDFSQQNAQSPRKTELLSSEFFDRYADAWSVSSNLKWVALSSVDTRTFRHSTLGFYNITSVSNGSYTPVEYAVNKGELVRLFKWSTSGEAYVYVDSKNDIWYKKDMLASSREIRITYTGSENIFNGVSDWLYEEEILSTDCALSFSPNGGQLTYMVFNDTAVKRINIDYYKSSNIYPETVSLPYPKVGETLPSVDLFVYSLELNRSVKLVPPIDVPKSPNNYLIHAKWIQGLSSLTPPQSENQHIVAVWSNRLQNNTYICSCSVPSYFNEDNITCSVVSTNAYTPVWMEPMTAHVDYASSDKLFTLLPLQVTDGYYIHVASLTVNKNVVTLPQFLTNGQWEVTSICGFDPVRQMIFFLAANPSPRVHHVFAVNISDSRNSNPTCLTCWMGKIGCNFTSAEFSPDGKYYVLYCQGPGVPKTYVRTSFDNETLYLLENNTDYTAYMKTKAMPVVKYKTLDIPDSGDYKALMKIMYPPGFDETSLEESYPLVLKVYAGPDSQLVLDNWAISFDTYLVTSRRFIVAYIDARGSGARGTKYTQPVYRNLAGYEIQDQISTLKLFENTSTYIRRDSLAVWGWSYGGFATAHMIKLDQFKTFKCAMSIAPVTYFPYYDAAYTERYMGYNNISDNYDGYQMYTNEQHSIGRDRTHLYTMLDNFLAECFGLKPNED